MTRKGSQVRVLYGPPLLSWENSPLKRQGIGRRGLREARRGPSDSEPSGFTIAGRHADSAVPQPSRSRSPLATRPAHPQRDIGSTWPSATPSHFLRPAMW